MKFSESFLFKYLKTYLKRGLKTTDYFVRFGLFLPPAVLTIFLLLQYSFIKNEIPFWYTRAWGYSMLAPKIYLWAMPIGMFFVGFAALYFWYFSRKAYLKYLNEIILYTALGVNSVLCFSAVRIGMISSFEYSPAFRADSHSLGLVGIFLLAFSVALLLVPRFISWANNRGLVTDPNLHQHPGMLLSKPSARGGGFVLSTLFLLLCLIFTDRSPQVLGVALGAFVAGVFGLLDDFQNTNPRSVFKFMENPLLRLVIILPVPVYVMMYFGITAGYINNPFNGDFILSDHLLNIGGVSFNLLPYLFTLFWTLWIMNLISWSNGVDGQFSGVVGIACAVVGVLALRLVGAEPQRYEVAKMAFIASGLAFGLAPFTWHPSKIMWGFGATSMGLILSALSIEARAKIAVSILVILVPFLDAAITVIRRLVQRKNPLKGDRGHLHHLLLARGWGVRKTALFYWVTTAVFGLVALLSSERSTALVFLTFTGLVAFFIVLLNVLNLKKKQL